MIKTRRTKRTFSPEFKLEAIEQVVKYQRDAREVAQALELNPDHLRKWIRLYKQDIQGVEPVGKAITPEQREISRLLNVWHEVAPSELLLPCHYPEYGLPDSLELRAMAIILIPALIHIITIIFSSSLSAEVRPHCILVAYVHAIPDVYVQAANPFQIQLRLR